MKNPWLVYVTVVVVSALAGVAIAGTPSRVGTDDTIVVPASTTTSPPPTTGAAVVDDESDVEPPASTAATTTAPAVAVETTTTAVTTTLPPEPEIVPAEVGVVAVNGAGVGGLAGRLRDELVALGFERARATDGTDFVDETVIYFLPDFEAEAAAVGFLLGIEGERIKPIAEAPDFGQLAGDQVAVYAGRDRS